MSRHQPNRLATRKPGPRASFRKAQEEARAIQQAEAARWEDIVCTDAEDVSPEDRAWAHGYWLRTYADTPKKV